MGGPISSPGADIFMDCLLDLAVLTIEFKLNIVIYCLKKYVDDLFLCVPSNLVTQILEIFNQTDSEIQFTCEIEQDLRLPFLDMLVTRDPTSQTLRTDWYMKLIASGRLLDYRSFHPMSQKLSTASGLIHRVFSLSNNTFHAKNKAIVMDPLRRNNYPKNVIYQVFNRTINRVNNNTITPAGEDTIEPSYYSFTYVSGVSERIGKLLLRNSEKGQIVYKNYLSLQHMFSKLKDKTTRDDSSNLVYAIDCADCPGRRYIGTTKQFLKRRVAQHDSSVRNQETEKSALAKHAVLKGHCFDFDGAKILERQDHPWKRYFTEELYIKSTRRCINVKSLEATRVIPIYWTRLGESVDSVGGLFTIIHCS